MLSGPAFTPKQQCPEVSFVRPTVISGVGHFLELTSLLSLVILCKPATLTELSVLTPQCTTARQTILPCKVFLSIVKRCR